MYVFKLYLLLLGGIFILTGILFFIQSRIMSGKTVKLNGTVIDFEEPRIASKYPITGYCPVVEYEYRGRLRRAKYFRYLSPAETTMKIDDVLKITVNPKLPGTYYFENDEVKTVPVKTCAGIAGIGLAALAAGLII